MTDTTDGLVTYSIAGGWKLLDGYDDVYYREVTASESEQSFNVLAGDQVTYSADLENEDMVNNDGTLKEGINLTFKAYAIQKEGFGDDPVAAYVMTASSTSVDNAEDFANALENGGGVILTDDISINKIVSIPENQSVVLDLNGQTITTQSGEIGQDRPIVNYGTLTVVGDGTIDTTNTKGYGVIRNYGTLTIEDGTFKGSGLGNGSAIDTQDGGITVINDGTYYATAAVMNRVGGTTTINGGDFEGVSNDNEEYGNGVYSYAIRNDGGTMTINDCYVHGSMNGGLSCSQSGTVTINGGYIGVEAPPSGKNSSFFVLVTGSNGNIIINDGIFEQKNGTNRLLGGFDGMPSWDATEDLAGNGYDIKGGTFILNGERVTLGQ